MLVPIGSKQVIGIAAAEHDVTPSFAVKNIVMALDDEPIVTEGQLSLWRWTANYYMSSLGDVMSAALPGGLMTHEVYRPKTETCVRLAPALRSAPAASQALNALRTAAVQRRTLECLLALCNIVTPSTPSTTSPLGDTSPQEASISPQETSIPPQEASISPQETSISLQEGSLSLPEITREELMNQARCSAAIVKALIDRGFVQVYEREVGRLNSGGEPHYERIKPLSEAQRQAYLSIKTCFEEKDVTLLHGVTSSGKTEIYIHLIREALDSGRQALYLLPEIALTIQLRQRLQAVFGDQLGIYHSRYSDDERVEIWRKQLSDKPYGVILGARSAVMLPFQRLGLVVVDEEHENSFKQQDPAPRYHARSVAVMLAKQQGAKVVLGSATPSMESYYNAQKGKYGYVRLSVRHGAAPLPRGVAVDVKDLRRRKMMSGSFSPALLSALRHTLASGRQAILFQNRRGYAPMVECHDCGWVPRCTQCDVALTYHRQLSQLSCHYCGATHPVPEHCPSCEGRNIRSRGYGTERIEDEISRLLPGARVARMDMDTTRTQGAHERILSDFANHRTDILVGTQMISKGLDFDNVSVVGILNADSMFHMPDFRAFVHAFAMRSQVAGRAGRWAEQGLVLLQTMSPQLPIVGQVVRGDCERFYADTAAERREFRYPPFHRLVYVWLKHRDDAVVSRAAYSMAAQMRELFGGRVLGPDKPVVARVKTLCIRKIVLKLEPGIDGQRVRQCLLAVRQRLMNEKGHSALSVHYDVDPQ